MSAEGTPSTRGQLLDMPSTSCTAAPSPSNPDVNQPVSLENTLDSDASCGVEGGHIDETTHDSCVDFMHIDDDHDIDNQSSNLSFGEDQEFLFSNENTGDEVHAGDLDIDLDGEFVILLPCLATEYF